jgi:peptide deformylase
MIHQILIWPHATLKCKSVEVEEADIPTLAPLVKDMIETLDHANGAGLSAVQIGSLVRLFIMRDSDAPGGRRVCFNPEIRVRSPGKELVHEGCLSIPGVFENVMRHTWIEAMYFDEFGVRVCRQLHGFPAQVFQHEFDHLQGKMYPDRLDPGAKDRLRARLRKAR